MTTTAVDHLVVAAATLADGVRWCEATLGATPAPGGKHALMSTHNRLLDLSSPAFPRCYLEIIAVDPEAPAPGRARWFGLDDAALQRRLTADGPQLIHMVARTDNLDMHRWGLIQKGFNPGTTIAASRGALHWRIVVRDDGGLEAGGALPTLIEWGAGSAHPCDVLPASGVALAALRLHGLGPAAGDVLRPPGVTLDPGAAAAPGPRATLTTPRGEVVLAPGGRV